MPPSQLRLVHLPAVSPPLDHLKSLLKSGTVLGMDLAPPPAPDLAGPFHTWERGADGGVVPSRTEAFADHHEGLSALMRGPDSPLAKLVAHLAGGPAGLKVCPSTRFDDTPHLCPSGAS